METPAAMCSVCFMMNRRIINLKRKTLTSVFSFFYKVCRVLCSEVCCGNQSIWDWSIPCTLKSSASEHQRTSNHPSFLLFISAPLHPPLHTRLHAASEQGRGGCESETDEGWERQPKLKAHKNKRKRRRAAFTLIWLPHIHTHTSFSYKCAYLCCQFTTNQHTVCNRKLIYRLFAKIQTQSHFVPYVVSNLSISWVMLFYG